MPDMLHAVEQALRRSHCERTGREHECVGTLKVAPEGIELNCLLCGGDGFPYYSFSVREQSKEMARLFGLQWDRLSHAVQQDVLASVKKTQGVG